MNKIFTIVGLGEVLWDVFSERKQLGGAPANFAYMTSLLGDRAKIASRVGADALGADAVQVLTSLGLDTSQIQRDASHETGTVAVSLEADGQPKYRILEPVAWDFLEWTDGWKRLASEADAVCFGSLAQRSPVSRETIQAFLHSLGPNTLRVFDVTLRQHFYSRDALHHSAKCADILKGNEEEIATVARLLGCPTPDLAASAKWLLREYKLKLLCMTRGEQGSVLWSERGTDDHPGHRVTVVDTVGAGDAFTAGLVHHYLRGSSLEAMNEAANRMGAWVASQMGATPPADPTVLASVRSGAA